MIKSITICEVTTYDVVGELLKKSLEELNKRHYRILNVFETKVNKIPRCKTDQGFIVVYDDKLPSAQPNVHVSTKDEDCISRQAEIDAWKEDFKGFVNLLDMPRDDYKGIMEYIDELPSAQPERTGKWIYNSPVTMKCNQCGLVIKDWDWHRFKYCPNCDADMRGEQDE